MKLVDWARFCLFGVGQQFDRPSGKFEHVTKGSPVQSVATRKCLMSTADAAQKNMLVRRRLYLDFILGAEKDSVTLLEEPPRCLGEIISELRF